MSWTRQSGPGRGAEAVPKPKAGTGQTSGFRSALAHPDALVRAAFVAQVAAAYGEDQDLGKTAERFGTSRRTLERAMADFQELGQAIQDVRNRIGVLGR